MLIVKNGKLFNGTITVDGYIFGDRMFEGVLFDIDVQDGKLVENSFRPHSDDDAEYFKKFNKDYLRKMCIEYVVNGRMDDEEVDIEFMDEIDSYEESGRKFKFVCANVKDTYTKEYTVEVLMPNLDLLEVDKRRIVEAFHKKDESLFPSSLPKEYKAAMEQAMHGMHSYEIGSQYVETNFLGWSNDPDCIDSDGIVEWADKFVEDVQK